MSSQNRANKPLTHSPLHGRSGRGDVGAGLSVEEYGRGVTVVSTGIVEPLSPPEQCNNITNFDNNLNWTSILVLGLTQEYLSNYLYIERVDYFSLFNFTEVLGSST